MAGDGGSTDGLMTDKQMEDERASRWGRTSPLFPSAFAPGPETPENSDDSKELQIYTCEP